VTISASSAPGLQGSPLENERSAATGHDEISDPRHKVPEGLPQDLHPRLHPQVKRLAKRVSGWGAAVGAVVGALSGLITTLLIVQPNLRPPTINRAQITQTAIEPEVTLDQYFQHPLVKAALHRLQAAYPQRTTRLFQLEQPRLATTGTVVHFEIAVQGLRGVPIGVRWSLLDGQTGKRLGDSQGLDPLPLDLVVDRQDSDAGIWETWVDATHAGATSFFVRLELYDERTAAGLTFQDSQKFPAEAR